MLDTGFWMLDKSSGTGHWALNIGIKTQNVLFFNHSVLHSFFLHSQILKFLHSRIPAFPH